MKGNYHDTTQGWTVSTNEQHAEKFPYKVHSTPQGISGVCFVGNSIIVHIFEEAYTTVSAIIS